MSQEEEKLIEECTCLNSQDFCQGCKNSLWNKAFRVGKLVGFEMWEELADKFLKSLFGKKDIHAMAHFTVGYIKSLIEEEKKKL